MKTILLFCLVIGASLGLSAQTKANLDIPSARSAGMVSLSNEVLEMTLIKGGYFTLGTSGGLSSTIADDYSQITFGHPFALTSFPRLYHEGTWQDLPKFIGNFTQTLVQTPDSLSLVFTDSFSLEGLFSMSAIQSGSGVRFRFSIRNNGNSPLEMGTAFRLDPALGNQGDGQLFLDGVHLEKDSLVTGTLPGSVELWERPLTPRGIGHNLQFPTTNPASLLIGNWNDLADGSLDNHAFLFDLCLEARWDIQTIPPGGECSFTLELHFTPPELPTGPFLRWDLPGMLTLADQAPFPIETTTHATLLNPGGNPEGDLSLQIMNSSLVDDWQSTAPFTCPGNSTLLKDVPLALTEYFTDTILDVNLDLRQSGLLIDRLNRKVFVPAAPFSNTGLVVDIDSISTAGFPEVKAFFNTRNFYDWKLVNNLRKNNLFPSEDGQSLPAFTLEKDTSGGANQADIVFILDVTGSMSDEIALVRDNIIEFADSLEQSGTDIQLGMVTFRDGVEDVFPLTDNILAFQQFVSQQSADGGGDTPENSLEALHQGSQIAFRPQAHRVFIWITDAPYHVTNEYTTLTINQVISELIYQSIEVYAISDPTLQTAWFDQIILNTGGSFFSIFGNFRDILLQISRMDGSTRYLLTYPSLGAASQLHTLNLEVHYQGKGGSDAAIYGPSKKASLVNCFPNPADSYLRIDIRNPQKKECLVKITDLSGRELRRFTPGSKAFLICDLDLSGTTGPPLQPGYYLVSVSFTDPYSGQSEVETTHIMITK